MVLSRPVLARFLKILPLKNQKIRPPKGLKTGGNGSLTQKIDNQRVTTYPIGLKDIPNGVSNSSRMTSDFLPFLTPENQLLKRGSLSNEVTAERQ